MPTIGLLIDPLDVLFFRDARPFGAGDQGASGLPLPQTFAGMIKTHLMHVAGMAPGELHGLHPALAPRERWPWFGNVCCRGPWLRANPSLNGTGTMMPEIPSGPLVAAPADLVRLGKARDARLGRRRPLEDAPPGWHPPAPEMRPLWHTGEESAEPARGFLDMDGLQVYLAGGVPAPEQLHLWERLYGWEPRTGIAVNPETGTGEEGRIYSVSLLRLRPGIGFYGEVDLPDGAPDVDALFPSAGVLLPWGGEGRRVRLRPVDPFDWGALCPGTTREEEDQRLLTLLVTPGLFASRAQPWKPRPQGTLVAAAAPRPLPVSGWDMAGSAANGEAGGHPRPTRWAVPAGAVYLWRRGKHRASNGAPPRLLSLTEKPMYADAGWGLALPGRWAPCEFPTPTTT